MAHPTELDSSTLAQLAAHNDWVEGWIPPDNELDFTDPSNKVSLVAAILGTGQVKPDETSKLEALGTYVGLAIASATGWPVKQLAGPSGTDIVVVFREPDDVIYPSQLILTQVQAGAQVDVFELVNGVIAQARGIIAEGW